MSTVYRWNSGAVGRNQTVVFGEIIYTVSNTTDTRKSFNDQVKETLDILEASLIRAGSNKQSLISIQVILSDISLRSNFDAAWCTWIGPDMAIWPQRACYQAGLAPGLLIEIIAVAGKNITQNIVTKKP